MIYATSREATEELTVALKEDVDEVEWSQETFGDLSETKEVFEEDEDDVVVEFRQRRLGYLSR